MKKRIFALFGCMVLLCTLFMFTASAEGKLLVDDAGLLDVDESTAILTSLNDVSNELDCSLVIMTANSCYGIDIDERSYALYNEFGYGRGENKNGVMLFISMEDSEGENYLHITPYGDCVSYFSEDSLNALYDKVVVKLKDKDYVGAFETYIKETRRIFKHETGFFTFQRLLAALAIGVVIGFIVVTSMKAKLKSVRFQPEANNYLKPGSLNVTLAEEHFLYHTVTRTARPKNNSNGGGGSHIGSGGVSRGASGRF